MPHTPSYRTYTLQCPANAGKLDAVETWVIKWRQLAMLERDHQIRRFLKTGGQLGLETAATQGWTRPWVQDGRASTTMAQQIMAQVAAQLKGHLGILKNAVQVLIGEHAKDKEAALDADQKHRLYSLNRHGLWLAKCAVKSPIKGEASLPRAAIKQGRRLLFQAIRQHAFPSFENYHPQLDQRNCQIDFANTSHSAFPLWARISPAGLGNPIALPLVGWEEFLDALAVTSQALAPGQAARLLTKRLRQNEKRKQEGKAPVDSKNQRRPLNQKRAALPQTLRLILDAAPLGSHPGKATTTTLRVAVVLDHGAHDALLREAYTPSPGKTVAFDLGMNVLLASSDGDLLGRNWGEKIERYSKIIDSIAAHRQRLGLPVRSVRYDAWVAKLDGTMKTQIYSLVDRFVARVKPERIIISDDTWDRNPNMSPRMNRLASRFGKRYLKSALAKLEATHGIVIEIRPGAYTSKQCHRCGYVDARNRQARDSFICKCCKVKVHADVNAARTSRDRRSAPATDAFWPTVRQTLREVVNNFTERNPRPEVLESRPIGRADDPRWTNPYFHAWQKHWTPSVNVAEATARWRKPEPASRKVS